MQQWNIMEQCELMSRAQYAKALDNVTVRQRYNALCASIMANAADAWEASSKQKEEQKMRESLQVGDEIVTIGGIIGRIVSIKDDTIVIETPDHSKIQLCNWAVSANNTVHE